MELLDLSNHSPEEYVGKIIYINDTKYEIGELLGFGVNKIVHILINCKSKVANHVIKIHRSQEATIEHERSSAVLEERFNENPKIENLVSFREIYNQEMGSAINRYNGNFHVQHLYINNATIPFINNQRKKYNFLSDVLKSHEYNKAIESINDYLANVNLFDTEALMIKIKCLFNNRELDKINDIMLRIIEIEPYGYDYYEQCLKICKIIHSWNTYLYLFEKYINFSCIPWNYMGNDFCNTALMIYVNHDNLDKALKCAEHSESANEKIAWVNDLISKKTKMNTEIILYLGLKSELGGDNMQNYDMVRNIIKDYSYGFSVNLFYLADSIINRKPLKDEGVITYLDEYTSSENDCLYLSLHLILYFSQNKEYHNMLTDVIDDFLQRISDINNILELPQLIIYYDNFKTLCIENKNSLVSEILNGCLLLFEFDTTTKSAIYKIISIYSKTEL